MKGTGGGTEVMHMSVTLMVVMVSQVNPYPQAHRVVNIKYV